MTPTRPRRVARQRTAYIYFGCPAGSAKCSCTARQDQIPSLCPACGTPWAARPLGASGRTNAAPHRRRGLGAFVYTPPSGLASAPFRNVQLAALPNTTIDGARKGQQHYTITDLLCPLALDGTSSSASDDHALVLHQDGAGGFTTRTGAAMSEARTLAARTRTLTGFNDIFEVFWYTLVPIVYEGRPDIGQQLFHLLAIAHDIARAHSWRAALQYINLIRHQYWMDPGVHRKHVLDIDTTFDLGKYDVGTFLNAHTLPPTSSGNSGPARGTPGSRPGVCNDWNRDACTRPQCTFAHRCAICGGGHPC